MTLQVRRMDEKLRGRLVLREVGTWLAGIAGPTITVCLCLHGEAQDNQPTHATIDQRDLGREHI